MIRLPWRYSLWLLRDMARGPLWPLYFILASAFLLPAVRGPEGQMMIQSFFPHILQLCGLVAVLALTGAIVSRDLGRGYYRVFFSRPVDPGGYYLLRWLLGAAAFYIFVVLFTGIISWKYGVSLPFFQYASQLSLQYLVLGSLVFFLSANSLPGDGAAAVPLCIMSAYAHGAAFPPAWLSALSWVLPPLHLASITTAPKPGETALHAIIYGLCLVAGSVVVLQRRRFAEGGRGD